MTKRIVRMTIAAILLIAGIGHFRATKTFMAQVPAFLPAAEAIIRVSGVVELVLGLALLVTHRYRRQVGIIVAVYFVLIFPGNIAQYVSHSSAFGLNTDGARALRLLLQPVLVALALWSTDAWPKRRRRWKRWL